MVSTGHRGQPELYATNFDLAAALAQLGRLEEARSAVEAGLALNPAFSISRARAWTMYSDNPAYVAGMERCLEGLRMAGFPSNDREALPCRDPGNRRRRPSDGADEAGTARVVRPMTNCVQCGRGFACRQFLTFRPTFPLAT